MLNIRVELIIAFVAIVMGIGVAWFLFGSLTPDDNAEGVASTEQSTTPSGESTMEAIMDDPAQPGELSAESSIEAVVEEVVQPSEAGTENPTESVVEELAQPADSVVESSIRSIVSESAQPADLSVESLNDSREFVDQVQEGLSDSGSEVEDWSADAFLEQLEREKTVGADVTLEDDLRKEILDAAHRDEIKPRKGDPYLSSLMDEASGLSVTAVNISEDGLGMVRNPSRGSRPTDSQGSQPADRFIIVEKGDSLSGLADRLYGDPKAYDSLFRANQDVLSSPNMLSVGQRLRVPSR